MGGAYLMTGGVVRGLSMASGPNRDEERGWEAVRVANQRFVSKKARRANRSENKVWLEERR